MKKMIVLALLCGTVFLCGCSAKQNTSSESSIDSNVIVVSDMSQEPLGDERIKRPASPEVSAPEGSISIDQACKLLEIV